MQAGRFPAVVSSPKPVPDASRTAPDDLTPAKCKKSELCIPLGRRRAPGWSARFQNPAVSYHRCPATAPIAGRGAPQGRGEVYTTRIFCIRDPAERTNMITDPSAAPAGAGDRTSGLARTLHDPSRPGLPGGKASGLARTLRPRTSRRPRTGATGVAAQKEGRRPGGRRPSRGVYVPSSRRAAGPRGAGRSSYALRRLLTAMPAASATAPVAAMHRTVNAVLSPVFTSSSSVVSSVVVPSVDPSSSGVSSSTSDHCA